MYKQEEFNKTKCQMCAFFLKLFQLYFRNVYIYTGYITFQFKPNIAYLGEATINMNCYCGWFSINTIIRD